MGPTQQSAFPFVLGQVMAMGLQQWLPQCIFAMCKYKIPDILGQSGPMTATEISKQVGITNVKQIEQVLRQLAAFGVLKEIAKGGCAAFELTPLSQLMRSDVPTQPDLSCGFFCDDPHPWNSLSRLTESM